MIEEHLKVPFETEVLGVPVKVTAVDITEDGLVVAVCQRKGSRQRLPILELPLPNPQPAGSEWIEAYRHWACGDRLVLVRGARGAIDPQKQPVSAHARPHLTLNSNSRQIPAWSMFAFCVSTTLFDAQSEAPQFPLTARSPIGPCRDAHNQGPASGPNSIDFRKRSQKFQSKCTDECWDSRSREKFSRVRASGSGNGLHRHPWQFPLDNLENDVTLL